MPDVTHSQGGNYNASSASSELGRLLGAIPGSNQAYLDAEERMNNARIAMQLATTKMEVDEARYEFDTAFFSLSAAEQEQLAWMRESFYADLEEKQREFNIGTYTDLATTLLNAATALHGPADWDKYLQYTHGGKDIFQALYGNEPAPAFGAPTGYSEPANIQQILQALGITQIPGGGWNVTPGTTGGTTTSGTSAGQYMADINALDAIWKMRPDLAEFYKANGWPTDTVEQQRAIVRNWIGTADPRWQGMTAPQVLAALQSGEGTQAATSAGTTAGQTAGTAAAQQASAATSAGQAQASGAQTPAATAAGTAAQSNTGLGWYDQMINWYNGFRQRAGRSPTQAEWQQAFQDFTGADAATAQKMYEQGANYIAQTGQRASAETQQGWFQGGGTGAAMDWYPQMISWYNGFTQQNGRAPTSQEWQSQFQLLTNATPEIAQQMYQRGGEYVGLHGQRASQETQQGWLNQYLNPPAEEPENVPLPHQVNIAVWNSMSPEAQARILGHAEAGYTSAGVITPGEYLRQLLAAAPKGTAPKRTTFNWGNSQPLF